MGSACAANSSQQAAEEAAVGAGVSPDDEMPATQLILVSDPGQDLDDEMAYIFLRYLVERGWVDLLGVVVTLAPAFDRARLCRGTLDTLGLSYVPVGVGTDGGDLDSMHQASTFEAWAYSYMPRKHSERSCKFEPGRRLLYRLYSEAEPQSLTLLVTASLKDPALFLRDNEAVFVSKTKEVVIMGGVEQWNEESEAGEQILVPDTAHNNQFDGEAARFFYQRCQELGVRLVVVSRWSAYAAKVPRSCYDELAMVGSSIGCRLRNAQRNSIEGLWNRACSQAGSAERKGLPDRCDRAWFLKTFCNNCSDPKGRTGDDTIWDLIEGFMQYDTVALCCSVDFIREAFFAPAVVPGPKNTRHLVVGRSEKDSQVSDSEGLTKFLRVGFNIGLSLNHRQKQQFILMLQARWVVAVDQLFACVVLRAMYELGILDCVAIIVCPAPAEAEEAGADCRTDVTSQEASVSETASQLRSALRSLGLAHIKVLEVSEPENADGSDAPTDEPDPFTVVWGSSSPGGFSMPARATAVKFLHALYLQAPPAGVFLLATSCLGQAADFATSYPVMFRERTQAVVLTGSAVAVQAAASGDVRSASDWLGQSSPKGNGGPASGADVMLQPDISVEDSKATYLDAARFYKLAQEMLVPLVVLSPQCERASRVPRGLFDALGTSGGAMGKMLLETRRDSIKRLWNAACADPSKPYERLGLPKRCDRDWFLQTFCPGASPASDADLWPAISEFHVYLPLAIFAIVPQLMSHFASGTTVQVRSVAHQVFGDSDDASSIADSESFRGFLCQCAFMGCRLNCSDFDLLTPPSIPLGDARAVWTYDSREEALDWILEESQARRAVDSVVEQYVRELAEIHPWMSELLIPKHSRSSLRQ